MPGLTGEACKRLKPTGVNHGRAKKTANKYRKPEISTGHQQNMKKIVWIYESNFRDAAASLRRMADDIEAGSYGEVHGVAVVLDGDKIEVFGMGKKSEPEQTALLLQAGSLKLTRMFLDYQDA
jgi:hypothetical protein